MKKSELRRMIREEIQKLNEYTKEYVSAKREVEKKFDVDLMDSHYFGPEGGLALDWDDLEREQDIRPKLLKQMNQFFKKLGWHSTDNRNAVIWFPDKNEIREEIAKVDFEIRDDEDFSWWSDRYKEENGVRPRNMTWLELQKWANSTYKLQGKRIIKREIREDRYTDLSKKAKLKNLKDILKFMKDELTHDNVKFTDVKFKNEKGMWHLTLKADGRPYSDWFEKDGDYFVLKESK